MKRLLKVLALTLSIMLALSGSAAFADEELGTIYRQHYGADLTQLPIVEEPLTIDVWRRFSSTIMDSLADCEVFKKMEELTNVHLEFTPVPSSDRATTLNLLFASGDLPDILFKMAVSSSQASQYGPEGMLIDLSQYKDAMPNFNYWLDNYPSARDAITQTDGSIYGCPYILTGYAIRMGSRFFFNSQVLEHAGLTTPPNTLDGFYDYLKAIDGWDYNENGEDDTIPLAMSSWDALEYILAGSFDVMNRGTSNYWVDQNEDGTARFWHTADGYKELMRYYHKLYEEGLVDPDVFTATFADLIVKSANGRALTYIFVNNSPVSGSPYEQYTVPMTETLEGYNGEKVWNNYSMPGSQTTHFNITKDCPEEYREIMAKWADYFYSVDGMVAYFMGEKDVTYTYDEATDTYNLTDMILKDPEGRNFEQVQSQWCTWAGGMNPSCATNELFKGGETWPVSLESAAGLIKFTYDTHEGGEMTDGAIWAPFVFDPDTASDISALTGDFTTYRDEWSASFITGKKDVDADWDEYVNGFNAIGVDEYLGYINEKIEAMGL